MRLCVGLYYSYFMQTELEGQYEVKAIDLLRSHCEKAVNGEKADIEEWRDLLKESYPNEEKIKGLFVGAATAKYHYGNRKIFADGCEKVDLKLCYKIAEIYTNLASEFLEACC